MIIPKWWALEELEYPETRVTMITAWSLEPSPHLDRLLSSVRLPRKEWRDEVRRYVKDAHGNGP